MDFNNILIGSEDPKRLVDFYTGLFGDPRWDDGGYTGWLIGTGAVTVERSMVSGVMWERIRVPNTSTLPGAE